MGADSWLSRQSNTRSITIGLVVGALHEKLGITMETIISKGQLLFGVAIAAYGVENIICAHLGPSIRGIPWFPANAFWEYVTGIALPAAGLSIIIKRMD
jgi:hypothetical protein